MLEVFSFLVRCYHKSALWIEASPEDGFLFYGHNIKDCFFQRMSLFTTNLFLIDQVFKEYCCETSSTNFTIIISPISIKLV